MSRNLIHVCQRWSRVLLAVVALAWGAQAQADEPLKIGFVYVSPVSDAGWTHQHDLGRQHLEAVFGDKVAVKYLDSVSEGAEAERVIRELAADGHQLVFSTSFGFMNPTLKVARSFPNVKFNHATGYKTAKNVGIYNARFYEGRYLAGIVAGSMTESNTLGYVAAFPIPEVLMGINAFVRGAQSVNPDVQLKVIWVNAWFDPGREREAADVLMDQGADIVTHHTDSTAVIVAAEEKGKYAIAYHSDMSNYGSNAHLTAVTHRWDDFYENQVQQVMDDDWKPGQLWGGIKDNMIDLAPFNAVVPDTVIERVNTAKKAIAAGELHPFAGPVLDQEGVERVAEGAVMSDEDLLKMDYYVKGVQGKLPN
ncbi:MAG: BMP family ABC transporter substrate-binding protein [Proteobacteria bacterium]|nr:MAG: BMP family ABC transporter substrate-binding protein [Pseudomonadota bacterium]